MSTDDMSVDDTPRSGSGQGPNPHGLSRRNLLLSGTTLAAASAEQGRDHDRDPLPLHLERARGTISIGFFSRRREINPESSFSVLG